MRINDVKIAQVAELVDALRSGRSSRKGVKVQILSWAPQEKQQNTSYEH